MKQVIIGDTHGRTTWKSILDAENDFDRAIFIGDYFDTHDDILPIQQLNNFEQICEYKRSSDKEVILLIGNHDFHYWPGIVENYSGYQPTMRMSFEGALSQNMDLLEICFKDEYKTVYSHAGFTEAWLKSQGIEKHGWIRQVKDLWKFRNGSFGFYPWDSSDTGDNINQGPLWVRPNSLYQDQVDILQVVGHTQVSKINHPAKSERRGFYLIDAIASRQYLVCQDGKFEVRQLPRG